MDDGWTIAALIAATAAAGVLRGYSGFGGALVMAPFFLRVVGPAESVTLISVIHLLTSLQGVRPSLRLADFGIIAPLAIAAIVSVPLGVLLLDWLEPSVVKTSVALIVVALALAMSIGARVPGTPTRWKSVAVGVLSGVLNGFCGIGGPPAILYVLTGDNHAAKLRAGFILFFALLYPVTVLALMFAGLITWKAVLAAALLAPVYFLTTEIGHALFRTLQSRLFVPVCMLVLCLSGLSMLFI